MRSVVENFRGLGGDQKQLINKVNKLIQKNARYRAALAHAALGLCNCSGKTDFKDVEKKIYTKTNQSVSDSNSLRRFVYRLFPTTPSIQFYLCLYLLDELNRGNLERLMKQHVLDEANACGLGELLNIVQASIESGSFTAQAQEDVVAAPAVQSLVHKFGTQRGFYTENIEKVCRDKDRPGKIKFYHYSGAAIEDLVSSLLTMGYEIKIYTQDPAFTRLIECPTQTDRIISHRKQYTDTFRRSGRLQIYESSVPLTVRAANIDDQHIVLGWYIYEQLDKELLLWGHDYQHEQPLYAIWLDAGDDAFDNAKKFLELYEESIAPRLIYPSDA